MTACIETARLIEVPAAGARALHVEVYYDGWDFDYLIYCGPLDAPAAEAQAFVDSGAALASARQRFLQDVRLTVKH